MTGSLRLSIVQMLALAMIALAAMPVGAHLLELPNKMMLRPEPYMIVQQIYRGWALFGVLIVSALTLTLLHAYLTWHNGPALQWSLIAFVALAMTQFIFWRWTYPINVLTDNWTVMPPNFEQAREQWEYSHAANAVVTLGAFVFMTIAVLASRPLVAVEAR